MKRDHLIIASVIICSIFLFVFNLGGHGKAASVNERVAYLIGKWKGACSFSIDASGFVPMKESLVLHVFEQIDRDFIGYIEGFTDGIPYRMELSGAVDARDRNIFAIDKRGTIYTGYFVTSHRMMLYSFENRGNPRIIQYKLRKYSDI
jgi:hypothetical protein